MTNIDVNPGLAVNSYDVDVAFNNGATIRGGFYLFTIRDPTNGNSSVQDIAGNHLDGVFYGSFPSGNGINGSDFVAMLSGYHNKIFGRPRRSRGLRARPMAESAARRSARFTAASFTGHPPWAGSGVGETP